jgi:hypothetical protein
MGMGIRRVSTEVSSVVNLCVALAAVATVLRRKEGQSDEGV